MTVIIAGSRSINDLSQVEYAVRDFLKKYPTFIITRILSGGARGVDRLGVEWAMRNGRDYSVIPADWKKFGRSAGHVRNLEMSKISDALIAVWDGASHGTLDMITIMRDLDKPYYIYTPLYAYL